MGRIAKPVQISKQRNGIPVARVTLEITSIRRNRKTREKHEHRERHKVLLFARKADLAAQFLQVGTWVYIAGSINTIKHHTENASQDNIKQVVGHYVQYLVQPNKEPQAVETATQEKEPKQGVGIDFDPPDLSVATMDREGQHDSPPPPDQVLRPPSQKNRPGRRNRVNPGGTGGDGSSVNNQACKISAQCHHKTGRDHRSATNDGDTK